MNKFAFIFLVFSVAISGAAQAQQSPVKGVVWRVPAELEEARRQLIDIRETGATAVRTSAPGGGDLASIAPVLRLADALNMDVYLDLPVVGLPARRLLDTLEYASAVLDTALALSRSHESLRNVGLARHADTSDPAACAYFEQLVDAVGNRAAAGLRFYYTTRFVESDACSGSVDFVMLDLLDHEDPIGALQSWRDQGEGRMPVGVGALGTWVRRDGRTGLRVPHSPERQARYLEDALTALLPRTPQVAVEAVFVFRWQDRGGDDPASGGGLDVPRLQHHGLNQADGTPRIARDVVTGIYSGRQQVFAFSDGDPQRGDAPWTTLLGWGVVLMLGIFYAASPRFRHMVPRYFQAHVFFRESVREGRDVLFGASVVLLIALGVSTGVLVAVAASTFQNSDAFMLAFSWLEEATRESAAMVLSDSLVVALLAACAYVLGLLVWTVILALITRTRYPMAPSQVLMLIVWTRWPILLLLPAAMVVASMESVGLTTVALMLGAWVLIELLAAGRTLYDLVGVSRIAGYFIIPGLLLHPGILLLMVAFIASYAYQPELTFLWHALTRS